MRHDRRGNSTADATLTIAAPGASFEELSAERTAALHTKRKDAGVSRRGLEFLVEVGPRVSFARRKAATLSGAKSEHSLRRRFGSGLAGFVSTCSRKPSLGLHQRDNERLIGTLRG